MSGASLFVAVMVTTWLNEIAMFHDEQPSIVYEVDDYIDGHGQSSPFSIPQNIRHELDSNVRYRVAIIKLEVFTACQQLLDEYRELDRRHNELMKYGRFGGKGEWLDSGRLQGVACFSLAPLS